MLPDKLLLSPGEREPWGQSFMRRSPQVEPSGVAHGPAHLSETAPTWRVSGRYAISELIASGGMASVRVGRMLGDASFARTVAIKEPHRHLMAEPEVRACFLDEARLVARIRHPNVVPTLDVVDGREEVFLVLEYVHGESLAGLLSAARSAKTPVPWSILSAIMVDALSGLHAAHEATSELGSPLDIVHRDVSPQNLLVGADGITRVVDFGIARAAGRQQSTRDGNIKGKIPYMAPEQLTGGVLTRRIDIYAASVVLWESLTGKNLFSGNSEAELLLRVLKPEVPFPSSVALSTKDTSPNLAYRQMEALDTLVLKGLAPNPGDRFATAAEMAEELARAVPPAPAAEVGRWVAELAEGLLAERAKLVQALERLTAAGSGMAESVHAPRPDLLAKNDSDPTVRVTPTEKGEAHEATVGGEHWAGEEGAAATAVRSPPEEEPRGVAVSDRPANGRRRMAVVVVPVAVVCGALLAALSLRGPRDERSFAVVRPALVEPRAHRLEAANEDLSEIDRESSLATGAAEIPASPPKAGPPPDPHEAPRARPTPSAENPRTNPRRTSATDESPKLPSLATADCDPPYTRDKSGVIVHKRECMDR